MISPPNRYIDDVSDELEIQLGVERDLKPAYSVHAARPVAFRNEQLQSRLFQLPGEVRNEVYRYALTAVFEGACERSDWVSFWNRAVNNLLSTCRKVRHEATPYIRLAIEIKPFYASAAGGYIDYDLFSIHQQMEGDLQSARDPVLHHVKSVNALEATDVDGQKYLESLIVHIQRPHELAGVAVYRSKNAYRCINCQQPVELQCTCLVRNQMWVKLRKIWTNFVREHEQHDDGEWCYMYR